MQTEYKNPDLLWTPKQLHARLGDPGLMVLDVRTTAEVLETGVIPGAQHLDLYGMGLTRATPLEVFHAWVNMMRSLLAMRGVRLERTVVLYEHKETGSRAGRAFWLLEYLGHADVHILDGGMAAWQREGLPLARSLERPPRGSLPMAPREEIHITADELAALLPGGEVQVWDTRNEKEYSGADKRGGPRGGTIPGAVYLEWTNFLGPEGCLKPVPEVAALLANHGIRPDKPVVPF